MRRRPGAGAVRPEGLGKHDGRVDLRGLPFPQPQRLRRFEQDGWFIEELSDRENG